MADMIKTSTGILTLKVSLLAQEDPTQVELKLERFEEGQNILQNDWRVMAADIGVAAAVDRGDMPLTLPEPILADLAGAVGAAAVDDHRQEPLWLHFAKPYGMIGGLDWETQLSQAAARPVFRLPDFLENIRVHPPEIRAAIVCDLPTDEPVFDVVGSVFNMFSVLQAGAGFRPLHIDIFVAEIFQADLTTALQGAPVQVHAAPETGGGWLEWISQATAGQCIDWLQFICHADTTDLSPSLAFTRGPCAQNSRLTASYISPGELARFLDSASAWGCGFAAPPDGAAALRLFADAAAQARAGPVLFQDIGRAAWSDELNERLACLLHPGVRDMMLAPNPGGFLYVQPERLGLTLRQPAPPVLDLKSAIWETVAAAPSPPAEQPAWAVSADMFLTAARRDWGLAEKIGAVMAEPDAAPREPVSVAEDTLKALEQLTITAAEQEGAR